MKYAWLVAAREYLENAKTKGFWIGILLFPVLFVLVIQVPRLLEDRAAPTRRFVLVDQSGLYVEAIRAALERRHQERILESLNRHAARYMLPEARREQARSVDLERISPEAMDPQKLLEEFSQDHPEALEAFVQRGGKAAFLRQIAPLLGPDAPPYEEPRRMIIEMELPEGVDPGLPPDGLARKLRPFLKGERRLDDAGEPVKLDAAVIIPPDIEARARAAGSGVPDGEGRVGVQYWATNLADTTLREEVERAINEETRRRALVAGGMDAEAVRRIQRLRAPIVNLNPTKGEGKEQVSVADVMRQWAPVGFVYLLWVSIFTVAQMLLNSTIEEKSNRIIEVLLSSVTAGELMMGKLLGIAAIGMTMLASWGLSFMVVVRFLAGDQAEWVAQLLTVLRTSGLLPAFALYFLLGYLMYAGIFLAIGSLCNTIKEAQNFMTPVIIVMIIPLATMSFIPKDPNGALATILSWIPFYSPFIMMNRAAAQPPAFDVVGTLVLMVISTAAALWLSGKVFRVGILRTGQPPRILELFRWLTS